MHIKRLLSGSLAALMVASSFNVPVVRAAEDEPTEVVEEAKVDTSGDDDVIVDDVPEVETEKTTEVSEPEETPVVEEPTVEAASEETTPEVVVEEAGEQEVVGDPLPESSAKLTVHFNLDGGKIGELTEQADITKDVTLAATAEASYAAVPAEINLPANPTKEGYTFAGWQEGTKTALATDAKTYSKDINADTEVTLNATWEAVVAKTEVSKLNFVSNGVRYTGEDLTTSLQDSSHAVISAKNGEADVVIPDNFVLKVVKNKAGDDFGPDDNKEVKNVGTYFLKVTAKADSNFTGSTVVEVKVLPMVVVVKFGDDKPDEETTHTAVDGKYQLYFNKTDSAKDAGDRGTIAQEVKPEIKFMDASKVDTPIATTAIKADDFTVVYADNNKVTKEAKATVTLKDSVKNYTFQEGESELTDVKSTTAKFEIVDNSVKAEELESVESSKLEDPLKYDKVDISDESSKDGKIIGYDKESGKLITKAIPAIDYKKFKVVGSQTEADFYESTVKLEIFDNTKEKNSLTGNFVTKKEIGEGSDEGKGVFVITPAAGNKYYKGTYSYKYDFKVSHEADEHVWVKEYDPADFYHAGSWKYVCECGEEPTTLEQLQQQIPSATAVEGTIPKLDAGKDDDYIRFTLNNGKAESLNKSIAYRGVAVTAEDVKVQLTDGTVIGQKVFNADDAANKVEHKNNIFTVTLSNNNAAGTAKLTIKFTDEIPEYEGATYTTEFEITPAVTDVEAPEFEVDRDKDSLGRYSYGTKVTLKTATKDAKILYTISTKETPAVDISDKDKYEAAIAAKKDIKTYDGNPIELTEDLADATSKVITIYAIAVKGDGVAYAAEPFTFTMLSKAADMGEVVEADLRDLNEDSNLNGEDIPDGLWISKQELDGITDATKNLYKYWDQKTQRYIYVDPKNEYTGYAKYLPGINNNSEKPYRIFFKNKLLKYGTDYTIKYTNNVNAASVSSTKAPSITITGKGDYAGGYVEKFEITPRPISDMWDDDGDTDTPEVKRELASVYPYEGSQELILPEKNTVQKPVFTATIRDSLNKLGYRKLALNKDYIVDYSQVKAAANEDGYTITINGVGNYIGSIERTLKVVPVGRYLSNAKVTIDTKDVVFDGTPQEKNVKTTVKIGDVELTEGTDYDVEYEYILTPDSELTTKSDAYNEYNDDSLLSAGKYVVKIVPHEGSVFLGEYVKTMNITNKTATPITKQSITGIGKTAPYTKPVFDIKVNNGNLKEGTDYLVGYSFYNHEDPDDSAFDYYNVTAGQTVKVTVYGIGKFSGYKTYSYKVAGVDVSKLGIEYESSVPYDGSIIGPAKYGNDIKLKLTYQPDSNVKAEPLEYGTDYEVTEIYNYENGKTKKLPDWTNVGKKTFTIEGRGRFSGKIKKTFTITPFDVNADQEKIQYNDKGYVSTNGAKLKFDYQRATNEDKYVTIGYTGTAEPPTITGVGAPNYLTDNAAYKTWVKQNFTFKYSNDYKSAGKTVKVTVTPKKNFKGSPVVMYYTVGQFPINDAKYTLNDKVEGKWTDPKPVLKNGKTTLKATKDYNIEYFYAKDTKVKVGTGKNQKEETRAKFTKIDPKTCKDIIPAGAEIKVRVTGIGNYTGEIEDTYKYVAKNFDISKATVKISGVYIYEKGKSITLDKKNISVVLNKKALEEKDFEIVGYEKNDIFGTAKVTLHGVGDFGGYKVATFKIDKSSMNYIVEFKYDNKVGSDTLTVTGSTKTLSSNKTNVFTLPNSGFKASLVKEDKTTKKKTTTNYVFTGWFDAAGKQYGVGEKFTSTAKPGEVVTLTAKFEAPTDKTYEIKFDGNKATGDAPKTITAKRGKVYTLPSAGKLKMDNMVFNGWSSDNGTTIIKAGTKIYNVADAGKSITYKAQWKAAPFKITYKLNGGKATNKTTYSYGDAFKLDDASKDGYKFAGWTDAKGNAVKEITKTTAGNLVLTANFTPYTYTVKYDMNGDAATEPKDGNSYTTGKDAVKMADAVTAKNTELTFLGWAKDKNSVKPDFKAKASVKTLIPTKDKDVVKLYAVWSTAKYAVTYDLGTAPAGKTSATLVRKLAKGEKLTLPAASTMTRPGYDFVKWYKASDTNKAAVTEITGGEPIDLVADWKEVTTKWAVTFDANGAKDADGKAVVLTFDGFNNLAADAEVTLPDLEIKNGNKHFTGWSTKADPKAEGAISYNAGATLTGRSNVTLYAIWDSDIYNITYVMNSGEFEEAQQATYVEGQPIKVANPERVGFKFTGWKYDAPKADGTTKEETETSLAAGKDLGLSKDVELRAQWEGLKNTITFTTTGAIVTTDKAKELGETVYQNGAEENISSLPSSDGITKAGYEFKGWAKSDAPLKVVTLEDLVADINIKDSEATDVETELVIVWDKKTFKLDYTGVEKTDKLATPVSGYKLPTKFEDGDSVVVKELADREAQTFLGWTVGEANKDNTPDKNLPLTAAALENSTNIVANWEDKAGIAVTYDANADDATGSVDTQTIYVGSKIATNSFVRLGYRFNGWASQKNGGGTTYSAAAVVSTLPTTDVTTDKKLTLYAQWTELTNTVKFDANGADSATSTVPGTMTFKTGGAAQNVPGCPDDLKKANSTFKGWNTKRTGTGENYMPGKDKDGKDITFDLTPAAQTSNKTITLYAIWKENPYITVSFDANGGTGTMEAQRFHQGETGKALADKEFTRAGYTFAGWNTLPAPTDEKPGISYDNMDTKLTYPAENAEDITLYAQWTANTPGITFELDEKGTIKAGEAPDQYTVGKTSETALPATEDVTANAGYTFAGWYVKGDESKTIVTAIPTDSTDDLTFVAKWIPWTVTVTFDVNGGTGSVDAITFKTGDTVPTLPSGTNLTAPTGKTFGGWSTKADGSEKVTELTAPTKANDTVTLYAIWEDQ